MSYVIHIWEEPVPTSLKHADELVGELIRAPEAAEPNQKYVEAAERLTAKYPFEETQGLIQRVRYGVTDRSCHVAVNVFGVSACFRNTCQKSSPLSCPSQISLGWLFTTCSSVKLIFLTARCFRSLL